MFAANTTALVVDVCAFLANVHTEMWRAAAPTFLTLDVRLIEPQTTAGMFGPESPLIENPSKNVCDIHAEKLRNCSCIS